MGIGNGPNGWGLTIHHSYLHFSNLDGSYSVDTLFLCRQFHWIFNHDNFLTTFLDFRDIIIIVFVSHSLDLFQK